MDFSSLSGEATSVEKNQHKSQKAHEEKLWIGIIPNSKVHGFKLFAYNTKIVQQIAQTSVAPSFSLI